MTKPVYEAPVLRTHGTFETQTRGAIGGGATDASFPVHTPFTDVTFT